MFESNPFGIPRPQEKKESAELFSTAKIELLGKRQRQEDVLGIRQFERHGKKILLAAVADGHGENGGFASKAAIDILLEQAEKSEELDEELLSIAFAEAHEEISKSEQPGGTTLTAAVVMPGKFLIGWVGNSQARVFTTDDRTLHTLTLPHEFGAHDSETSRLKNQHALIINPLKPYSRDNRRGYIAGPHGGYIEVSRALGDTMMEPYVLHEPEIKTVIPTKQERFLILASDGLWNLVTKHHNRKVVEAMLATAKDAAEVKILLERQIAKWQPEDNTAVLIVDLKQNIRT